MDVRAKMIDFREQRGLTQKDMALCCEISEELLDMVEFGHVTHPAIVKRIQVQYELTDLEAEALLPMHRRPHGGDYDPDRYGVWGTTCENAESFKDLRKLHLKRKPSRRRYK